MALLVWHSLTQIPLLLFHQHHKIKHLKTRLVHYSFVNKRGGGGKKELGGRGEGGNDDHDDFHSAVVVQIDKTDDDKLKKNPHHDSSEDSEEEHTTATSNSPPRQEWPWLMTFITGIIRGSAVARIHTIPLARSMTSALLTDLILDGDCRILQTHFNVNREKLLECEKNADLSCLGDYIIPPETSPENIYRLEGEWIGRKQDLLQLFQSSSSSSTPSSQKQQQQRVILFVHGGALFAGNPKTHRNLTWRYAKETGSVVFSINYRKCPEHPFPASLHDVYAAYLHLTNPSHPAFNNATTTHHHLAPIHPSRISIVGDSAGAGIAMSFLLYLKHVLCAVQPSPTSSTSSSSLLMPASSVLLSPWVDLTCCKRSWVTNRSTDFVPTMNFFEGMFEEGSPVLWYSMGMVDGDRDETTNYLAKRTWFKPEVQAMYSAKGLLPAHIQADLILRHPLMSPMFFQKPTEMPPILILNGDSEVLRDESIHLFKTLHRYNNNTSTNSDNATTIRHLIYANMPHIFQLFDGILEMQCFQHKIVESSSSSPCSSRFEMLHIEPSRNSSYARVIEFLDEVERRRRRSRRSRSRSRRRQ